VTAIAPGSVDPNAARDQALAGQLLVACNAAMRVLRIHDEANEAVQKPLEGLAKLLEELSERHPRVVLAVVEGVFYLDTTRIRLSTAQLPVAQQLAEELTARGVGGLTFDGSRPIPELILFFKTLDGLRGAEDVEAVRKALAAAGIANCGVSKILRPITESDAKKSAKDQAADVYVAAIKHVAQVVGTKSVGGTPRSKRIIHELVDLADNDPVTLLALAGLRDTGSEESEHSVAVGALSIALGRRIGLGRDLLADLGIAALHHDAGLAELGEGAATDVDRHPVVALKAILKFAPTEALFRQVLCSFEHHRDFNGEGGRPNVPGLGKPHLFSQIIRVVNDFDGLTRGRRGVDALDVGVAIETMRRGAGSAYNPILLELFVDLVGGVESEDAGARATGPTEVDLALAEFLGKELPPAPPPPPPPPSETDLLLAEFLGKELPPAPAAAPPAPVVSDMDLMLAEFLGKKEEVVAHAASVSPPPAAGGPKKTALGALKLKRVPRKKSS
jgi:response regulator RpfG family c-di-GMP phosphodiesterase